MDNDAQLRHRHSHLTSQKRGDMAINAQVTDLQVLLPDHAPVSQFIVDVNLCAMVNSNGIWGGSYNARTGHFDNHTLVHKAHAKHTKHAAHYANIGYGFVAFVASCFGVLGPSAARLLMALASLELRQHDAFRARTGLDPLVEESARSQFRALCFRQSSARLGHALAKATVKRLLASPSLPLPSPPDRSVLARNRPGPADFLSPVPHPPFPL